VNKLLDYIRNNIEQSGVVFRRKTTFFWRGRFYLVEIDSIKIDGKVFKL
jgi:hypothetical protein